MNKNDRKQIVEWIDKLDEIKSGIEMKTLVMSS